MSKFLMFEQFQWGLHEKEKKAPPTQDEYAVIEKIAGLGEEVANMTVFIEEALANARKALEPVMQKRDSAMQQILDMSEQIRHTKITANEITTTVSKGKTIESVSYKSIVDEMMAASAKMEKLAKALKVKYTSQNAQPDKVEVTDERDPEHTYKTTYKDETEKPAVVAEGVLDDMTDKLMTVWKWFADKVKKLMPQVKEVNGHLDKALKALKG